VAILYFEDLPVGRELSVGGYALEREEMIAFARRWDPYPFHTDEAAAEASVFGGLTASSCHIVAICTALFHRLGDAPAILAMLGKDRLVFPNPARPDDVLEYRAECIEARASRKHGDRGVVRFRDGLQNQAGEAVLRQEVALLVARRPPATT
jgi:acyl dehydratase